MRSLISKSPVVSKIENAIFEPSSSHRYALVDARYFKIFEGHLFLCSGTPDNEDSKNSLQEIFQCHRLPPSVVICPSTCFIPTCCGNELPQDASLLSFDSEAVSSLAVFI